jgi:hypothetical protein
LRSRISTRAIDFSTVSQSTVAMSGRGQRGQLPTSFQRAKCSRRKIRGQDHGDRRIKRRQPTAGEAARCVARTSKWYRSRRACPQRRCPLARDPSPAHGFPPRR